MPLRTSARELKVVPSVPAEGMKSRYLLRPTTFAGVLGGLATTSTSISTSIYPSISIPRAREVKSFVGQKEKGIKTKCYILLRLVWGRKALLPFSFFFHFYLYLYPKWKKKENVKRGKRKNKRKTQGLHFSYILMRFLRGPPTTSTSTFISTPERKSLRLRTKKKGEKMPLLFGGLYSLSRAKNRIMNRV